MAGRAILDFQDGRHAESLNQDLLLLSLFLSLRRRLATEAAASLLLTPFTLYAYYYDGIPWHLSTFDNDGDLFVSLNRSDESTS